MTLFSRGEEFEVDTETLPWVPIPGTQGAWFKLLRVNQHIGGLTMLVRVEAGGTGPRHLHFGAVEYWVVKGHISETLGPGTYVYEPGGYNHEEPTRDEEVVLFLNAYGPIQTVFEDGSTGPVLDAKGVVEYYERRVATPSRSAN